MVYSSKPQCFKTESKIINKCGQSDLIISSTVFRFRAFHIPVGCGSDLERGGCWSEDGAGAGQTQSRCGLERQRGRRSSGRGSERSTERGLERVRLRVGARLRGSERVWVSVRVWSVHN